MFLELIHPADSASSGDSDNSFKLILLLPVVILKKYLLAKGQGICQAFQLWEIILGISQNIRVNTQIDHQVCIL